MTEAEWLAATDPRRMLCCVQRRGWFRQAFAGTLARGWITVRPPRATERQTRLLACACCRQLMLVMTEDSRRAVEVAERYADGIVARPEFDHAMEEARLTLSALRWRDPSYSRAYHQRNNPPDGAWELAAQAAVEACRFPGNALTTASRAERAAEVIWGGAEKWRRAHEFAGPVTHETLIRDIFGNPFRPALDCGMARTSPYWGLAVRLSQAAYEERRLPDGTLDPTRLALLADALEDAGCTDVELLGHVRGPGPHVRGCWALDLVLSKS
jgi:hypothetical protein